jgi:HemY protein
MNLGRWRARRRRVAGDAAVTRTLVALAANDVAASRSESARARRFLGDTAQTLLHCAEAARLAGHETEAAALYERLCQREDGRFLGLRGLFRQAIAREDWAEAQRLATDAEAVRPGGLWLREERAQLAVRLGNWTQALALAGPETPRNALVVAAAQAEPDSARALRLAKRVYVENPGFAPAAIAYAGRLRAAGRENRAREALREAWTQGPHPDIAALYLAPFVDPRVRVREGTQLAQANLRHAESQFLMARLTFEAGLMLEARKYADDALALGLDQRRLWHLMSDITKAELGEGELSLAAQAEVMRHAAMSDPDPVWLCEACGVVQPAWSPACPSCHIPGRMVWGSAQRPRMLAAN